MGSALGSSGLSIISTVALAVAAILLIFANDNVRNISGFSSNKDLQNAHGDLVYAQIFLWIATAFSLLLTLGYIFKHIAFLDSEIPHLVIWFIAVGTAVTGLVFAALGLSKLDSTNNTNADGYLWATIIISGVAILMLGLTGGWRVAVKSTETTDKTTPALVPITTTSTTTYQPPSVKPEQPDSIPLSSASVRSDPTLMPAQAELPPPPEAM